MTLTFNTPKKLIMKILFLDDDVSRVDIFQRRTTLIVDHVTNIKDFITAVNTNGYNLIMLDHDLGNDEVYGTGNDAAKYLANNRCLLGDNLPVIIHSANPIGAANMMASMKHAEHLNVYVIPNAWLRCQYTTQQGLLFRHE